MSNKAFMTGWDGTSCVVPAMTASKARYVTFKGAVDAGYSGVLLTDITARRCPKYDEWAKAAKPKCYGEEFVRMESRISG